MPYLRILSTQAAHFTHLLHRALRHARANNQHWQLQSWRHRGELTLLVHDVPTESPDGVVNAGRGAVEDSLQLERVAVDGVEIRARPAAHFGANLVGDEEKEGGDTNGEGGAWAEARSDRNLRSDDCSLVLQVLPADLVRQEHELDGFELLRFACFVGGHKREELVKDRGRQWLKQRTAVQLEIIIGVTTS